MSALPAQGSSYALPGPGRAAALVVVAALHVALLMLLSATGSLPLFRAPVLAVRLIASPRMPPAVPRLPEPILAPVPEAMVPSPEIALAVPSPPRSNAIRTTGPAAPRMSQGGHFGAASDSGLGLDVAVSAGGGAGGRGALAGFEAAVRQRVLANKHQPALAWDRRQTCVVNYRVSVGRNGAMTGLSIDPCAVPEINDAARAAIRAAAPFPLPPETVGTAAEVSGSLIFHP